VGKSFGAVTALRDADFDAAPGEVHALVGENGAGKSTLIKILAGVLRPDAGTVEMDGEAVRLTGPQSAQRLGVQTVFQELTLLPWMTVAENLLLLREPLGPLGLIRRRHLAGQAEAMLAELGVDGIDVRDLVSDLPLSQRQTLEIVRAVRSRPRVLFLDEPTSSLAERAVSWLFELVERLRAGGCCVVFTSHRWREIERISDRITIFRNGARVGTYDQSMGEEQAITLMTGRQVGAIYPGVQALEPPVEPALQVRELTGERLDGLTFDLGRGEILGVGGLAGQGHRELFMSLFGAGRARGEVLVGGRPVRLRSPRDAIRAGFGIALVPEDRKREGLFPRMTVRENLTLPVLGRLATAGFVDRGRERGLAATAGARLQIRAPGLGAPVSSLSGGNQQKVLIGRWLLAESRILLLYDITRGVDIATKRDIYELVVQLAAEGRSILFYSSETDELANLCHRVLVLREGRLAADIRGPAISSERIVAAAVRDAA
jgi:ribose transport system ATP-binding protein